MHKPLLGALVAATALLAACGSDGDSSESTTPAPAADTQAEAPSTEAASSKGGYGAAPATEAPSDEAPSTEPPTTEESTEPAAAFVTVTTLDVGEALVDGAGLTLYGFTPDADGLPTCTDGCADAWPPLIVESADLPAGLDASLFTVVERDDGTFQLKAGKWPLYRFAGDAAAGDANGQGSGGVWFVAASDGSLIEG